MNSSNSSSPSLVRDRRRTPMACTNCRLRKLKCRPVGSVDGAPCERCVKEEGPCEYRPVDSSSTSNNHSSNYPYQDDPVNLYYPHSAPSSNQESVNHLSYVPTQGGYAPNQTFTGNPAMHVPFQPNHHPTPPFQPQQPSSYPVTNYSYNSFPSVYPAEQANYQSTSQVGSHPQYMSYQPTQGQGNGLYGNRDYSYNGYENMDSSNSARE